MDATTEAEVAAQEREDEEEAMQDMARYARRVRRRMGLSMDLLLRMQAWHDASRMRARADEIDVRRYQPA